MKKNIYAVLIILVAAFMLNTVAFGKQKDSNDGIKKFQNFPNPFSETTTVKFSLSGDSKIKIFVVNKTSGVIIDLADGFVSAGEHGVIFKSPEGEKGEYTCTIQVFSSDENTVLFSKEIVMLKR